MLFFIGEQVFIVLLSLVLQEIDQFVIFFIGVQVGIVIEVEYSWVCILEICFDCLEYYLREGKVVVVVGFQGISSVEYLEIIILGWGGLDIFVVVLVVVLKVDFCEIYIDVLGIFIIDFCLVLEV